MESSGNPVNYSKTIQAFLPLSKKLDTIFETIAVTQSTEGGVIHILNIFTNFKVQIIKKQMNEEELKALNSRLNELDVVVGGLALIFSIHIDKGGIRPNTPVFDVYCDVLNNFLSLKKPPPT